MKSIQLPDDIYERAALLAERDNVSVDKFVAALVHEHAYEWERLRTRAERGSTDKLKAVLARVSDPEPEPFDGLL
jgi:hypothetical protein